MDEEGYRKAYFVEPRPQPRYDVVGCAGVALFYEDYEAAAAYYTQVLGPPDYVEGRDTLGWSMGSGWLTLLKGDKGGPCNVEVIVQMTTPADAERLHAAFIEAGGEGPPPADRLM